MKISIMSLISESFLLQFFNSLDSFTSPENMGLKVDENQHNVFNQREFSSANTHAVLTHSLPQRTWGLKVDENQHNVFNHKEFSSAIIHRVLTHSLPQRILGLKVDENQHNDFNQRESFPLQLYMKS